MSAENILVATSGEAALKKNEANRATLKSWSLRRRFMIIALLAVLLAWVAGGTAMYFAADEESDRLFDARLQDLARTIISFAEHEILEIKNDGRTDKVHQETEATLGSRYQFQIWDKKGELLLRSHNASDTRMIAPLSELGYANRRWEMREFRTYSMIGPLGQFRIQVAENLEERGSVTGTLSSLFLSMLVLTIALVSFLTWLALRSMMRSIDDSAAQLLRRTPDDLTQVNIDSPPAELMPMISSINNLFTRIEHTLSQERGFTATAAHELRTPLAALRLQAQVASRARTQEQRDTALAALMECVDRSSHLLDQLLALAKLDDLRVKPAQMKEIQIQKLLGDLMRDVGPQAAEKNIRFKTNLVKNEIYGIDIAVSMLLRNLLANAVKYTPVSGSIMISSNINGEKVDLIVDDSGPGVPIADRARVFERFYRLNQGRSVAVEGVGLGLAIVRSVADAHNATITLDDSPLGGLRVIVSFPGAPLSASLKH